MPATVHSVSEAGSSHTCCAPPFRRCREAVHRGAPAVEEAWGPGAHPPELHRLQLKSAVSSVPEMAGSRHICLETRLLHPSDLPFCSPGASEAPALGSSVCRRQGRLCGSSQRTDAPGPPARSSTGPYTVQELHLGLFCAVRDHTLRAAWAEAVQGRQAGFSAPGRAAACHEGLPEEAVDERLRQLLEKAARLDHGRPGGGRGAGSGQGVPRRRWSRCTLMKTVSGSQHTKKTSTTPGSCAAPALAGAGRGGACAPPARAR